jgi:hypothetical protein
MKIDPNNPQSLFAATADLFKGTQTVLMGVMDDLPEAFKPQFAALKAKVDAALASLAAAPTTQVPAAQEASYALNHMAHALTYMKELHDQALATVDRVIKEATPRLAQLNELTERVTRKELLEKAEVEAQVSEARTAAVAQERERSKLMNDRRSVLAGDNLPVPADEAVLAVEPKDFEALRATAGSRVKALREAGHDTQLNSGELADLVYGPEKDFDRLMKLVKRVSGAPSAEPFAGGGSRQPSAGQKPLMVI